MDPSFRSRPPSWATVRQLSLLCELRQHDGCVNRLAWSPDGSALASVSDDTRLVLWKLGAGSQPSARPTPVMHAASTIATGHTANIFGVAWSPTAPPAYPILITGGMDGTVRVHCAEPEGWRSQLVWRGRSRVKAIAASHGPANLAWAALESGSLLQFDLRDTLSLHAGAPLIVARSEAGEALEAHSVATSPSNDFHLAVATTGEAGVRLYDRRMLPSLASPTLLHSKNVLLYAPLSVLSGHLGPVPRHADDMSVPLHDDVSVTHTEFDATGRHLLGAFGAHGVFVFDVLASDGAGGSVVESFGGAEGGLGGGGAGFWAALDGGEVEAGPSATAEASVCTGDKSRAGCAAEPPALPWLPSTSPSVAPLPSPDRSGGASLVVAAAALRAATQRHKDRGNAAFRAAQWGVAVEEYCRALEFSRLELGEVGEGQEGGGVEPATAHAASAPVTTSSPAVPTAAMLNANLAAARLKRGAPGEMSDAALAAALAISAAPHYWKAYLRLARALRGAEQPVWAAVVARRVLAATAGPASPSPFPSLVIADAEARAAAVDATRLLAELGRVGGGGEVAEREGAAATTASAGEGCSGEGSEGGEAVHGLAGQLRNPAPHYLLDLILPPPQHQNSTPPPAEASGVREPPPPSAGGDAAAPSARAPSSTAAGMATQSRGQQLCFRHSSHCLGARNQQTDIKEAAFWGAGGSGNGAVRVTIAAAVAAYTTGAARRATAEHTGDRDGGDDDDLDADAAAAALVNDPCWGRDGFIVAGSDGGRACIFDRATGCLVAALPADASVCNAVRPHPSLPWLATSGIESVVRLWGPSDEGVEETALVSGEQQQQQQSRGDGNRGTAGRRGGGEGGRGGPGGRGGARGGSAPAAAADSATVAVTTDPADLRQLTDAAAARRANRGAAGGRVPIEALAAQCPAM